MKIKTPRLIAVLTSLLVIGSSLLVSGSALAASSTKKVSSTKSSSSSTPTSQTTSPSLQGYASASPLQFGLIVELAKKNSVAPAPESDAGKMYGVTVNPDLLSFTISGSNLPNEAYVATSGTYDVLVSNQAGPIKTGDFLTVSSIDGVAMDAGTTNTTVLGRAAADFTSKSATIGTETLKNSSGSTQAVSLGVIPVSIQIEHNPTKISTTTNLPKSLQKIGQALADKPISPLKVYLSIAITVTCIVVSAITMYSGIKGSLIAIGRNPMSKKTIYKSLFSVILSGFIILLIGFFAVYLLLKL